jgi:hypothetical protein
MARIRRNPEQSEKTSNAVVPTALLTIGISLVGQLDPAH